MSGYFDAAIYVVISSISFVFLKKLCNSIDPLVALFIMSGIGIINFNILSINKIKDTYISCIKNKTLFLIMSGSLGLDWVCMLYSSYYADPFVSLASLFIFLAIVGFTKLFLQDKNKINLFSVCLLLTSAVILYFGYHLDNKGNVGLGILLGSVAGIAFYFYISSSKKLAEMANLSSLQVLATRFWVLFLGSAIFVNYNTLQQLTLQNIGVLVLISYGSLIIPIYFNQQAIVKLGSELTSVFISFVPPVTYFVYTISNRSILLINVIICLFITVALIMPNIYKFVKSK